MSQARTNVSSLRTLVRSIDAFGAVADGTTDNRAAFVAAAAEDGIIQLGVGTYVINLLEGVTTAGLPIQNITRISGLGPTASVLRFVVTDTIGARNLFAITGRLALENLRVELVNGGDDTVSFFRGAGLSGLHLSRCQFDGGLDDTQVTAGVQTYGIFVNNTGTHEDITVENCDDIRRFTWFFVKANEATSVQRRLRFRGNRFREHYRTALQLNSPKGDVDDVDIDGNTFEGGAGYTMGEPNCFHVAPMGTNIRIRHNRMSGVVDYAIHCEENLVDCLIEGNQIDCDAAGGGGGVRFINNLNGDGVTYVGPRRVQVVRNTITYLGTAKAAGTRGVLLNNDADVATVDNSEIDVVGNRLTGFEYGILGHGNLGDSIRALDNYAINCGQGFRSSGSQFIWRGNTSQDCTTGVYAAAGGCFADHTFIDCTALAAHVSRYVQLVNPRIEFSPVSVGAASSTDFATVLIGANDRVQGTASIYAVSSDATYSAWYVLTTTWDGAALTTTALRSRAGAGFTFTGVSSGGALVMRLASTPALTDVRVAVQFSGEALVG